MRDLLEDVIDEDVALENLRRLLVSGETVPRTLVAPALLRLECGHVRPCNRWFDEGESFFCLVCGPKAVAGVELLPEPEEFPAPDALFNLPETSVVSEDLPPSEERNS